MPAAEALNRAFLSGGGDLGGLIADFDWSATPLGPIDSWPGSLRTTVSLILRSPVPMVTLWGETGVMIYNDAYSAFSGTRHPRILGSNVREGWPEVADFNDRVMKTGLNGGTLSFRDQEMVLNLSGKPEKVWMNLDYSPILDESGTPSGVIAIVVETTAKVRAETWRTGERDRQRQMFEQAPGFVGMLSGPEHVFELTNAAYMQLIGHRDVIGLTVRQALPELEGQGFFELLDRVFQTGERFIGSALRADLQRDPGAPKEQRIIDFVYQPVLDPQGGVVGIFVQGEDVTDRMRAETALRESEALFRGFAESIPNHVWTATPAGLLDWFNPRVYDYSGAAFRDLAGEIWVSMLHPEDVETAATRWTEAIATGGLYETEFRLRRHDGTYRWHIARAVPIRDASGAIRQWIGTNTDIDDQKTAIQALRDSERRLQLSQNAAGITALEVDIASGMVIGSETFWQIWGLEPRDSAHISLLENIVVPEDRAIRSTPETRALGSAVANVEYRIRRPDTGELRWLSRAIEFQRDPAGKPIKMFGVVQDITERKEIEARQVMLTHELEHRIKNILAMVAAIASQTLRNTDIDSARGTFNERLRALANAHDILNSTRWTNASMRQVIENTIAALPADQITITGPELAILPKMALTLALAVNELATNALKYGALSTQEGRVAIDWHLISADTGTNLIWRWTETGGPPVTAPTRRGFGSFLIERVFGADFGGTVRLDPRPEGLECVLTCPAPDPRPNSKVPA